MGLLIAIAITSVALFILLFVIVTYFTNRSVAAQQNEDTLKDITGNVYIPLQETLVIPDTAFKAFSSETIAIDTANVSAKPVIRDYSHLASPVKYVESSKK